MRPIVPQGQRRVKPRHDDSAGSRRCCARVSRRFCASATTSRRPISRRSRSATRRRARWATWRCRSRSSWRAGCARRRASIAQELAGALTDVEGVARLESTANGYLNVFLDRAAFLRSRLDPADAGRATRRGRRARRSSSTPPSTRTRRRTSAICATRRSATRWCGCCASAASRSKCRTTSTTPASRSPTSSSGSKCSSTSRSTSVRALAAQPRFDYYCWDLYARVTEWYQEDKARLEVRQHALHQIEHGGNPTAEMAAFVADAIVRRHLETMHRLGIEYDLLTWEGDILRLRFWAHAFEILKTARHDLPADRGPPRRAAG